MTERNRIRIPHLLLPPLMSNRGNNAIKTGMLAAEAAFERLRAGSRGGDEIAAYPVALRASWVWEVLRKVRNVKPSIQYGLWIGTIWLACICGLRIWGGDF